jgi:hypothetical protein
MKAMRTSMNQRPVSSAQYTTVGWLERFLVLTAVVSGLPTAVGLIIAAKSIFRFPEIKGRPFTEYFLIGTLLSITIAVIGGLSLTALLTICGSS